MSKIPQRLLLIFLVTCLVADPQTVSAFISSPASLSPMSVETRKVFYEQALIAAVVGSQYSRALNIKSRIRVIGLLMTGLFRRRPSQSTQLLTWAKELARAIENGEQTPLSEASRNALLKKIQETAGRNQNVYEVMHNNFTDQSHFYVALQACGLALLNESAKVSAYDQLFELINQHSDFIRRGMLQGEIVSMGHLLLDALSPHFDNRVYLHLSHSLARVPQKYRKQVLIVSALYSGFHNDEGEIEDVPASLPTLQGLIELAKAAGVGHRPESIDADVRLALTRLVFSFRNIPKDPFDDIPWWKRYPSTHLYKIKRWFWLAKLNRVIHRNRTFLATLLNEQWEEQRHHSEYSPFGLWWHFGYLFFASHPEIKKLNISPDQFLLHPERYPEIANLTFTELRRTPPSRTNLEVAKGQYNPHFLNEMQAMAKRLPNGEHFIQPLEPWTARWAWPDSDHLRRRFNDLLKGIPSRTDRIPFDPLLPVLKSWSLAVLKELRGGPLTYGFEFNPLKSSIYIYNHLVSDQKIAGAHLSMRHLLVSSLEEDPHTPSRSSLTRQLLRTPEDGRRDILMAYALYAAMRNERLGPQDLDVQLACLQILIRYAEEDEASPKRKYTESHLNTRLAVARLAFSLRDEPRAAKVLRLYQPFLITVLLEQRQLQAQQPSLSPFGLSWVSAKDFLAAHSAMAGLVEHSAAPDQFFFHPEHYPEIAAQVFRTLKPGEYNKAFLQDMDEMIARLSTTNPSLVFEQINSGVPIPPSFILPMLGGLAIGLLGNLLVSYEVGVLLAIGATFTLYGLRQKPTLPRLMLQAA